ncbi:MAG TPA: glycosyltransferase [Solirubrobacteraceae bacterium]|nr:glycosyltransferase [Solirubrobacteraceae bacterium]
MAGVVAVVVTFDRRAMLLECLDALAAQTAPLDDVIVVDNASDDGTAAALEGRPVTYLRLRRNGGAAEGEHYGMAEALARRPEWVWLMDDDCAPDPDALERLLASPRAQAPDTVALAPVAVSAGREPLPLDRGRIRRRWGFAPLSATPPPHGADVEIDFSTFVGPLVRGDAARRAGLPLRRAFIRNEDVEYFARLRRRGRAWMVRGATIVHRAPRPFTDASLRGRAREYARPDPFDAQWKHLYALRNLVWAGRRHGFLTGPRAAAYVAVQALRRLLFAQRRVRAAWLTVLVGVHGWRGVFRSVPPDRWAGIATARRPGAWLRAHALTYDEDVAEAPRRPV